MYLQQYHEKKAQWILYHATWWHFLLHGLENEGRPNSGIMGEVDTHFACELSTDIGKNCPNSMEMWNPRIPESWALETPCSQIKNLFLVL